MDWQVLEDAPGRFSIRVEGVDVGMFSLLDTAPVSGVPLYPAVRARVLRTAFRDFDDTVVLDQASRERAEYVAAGWTSRGDYHAQVEANRQLLADFPADVRAEVATAFARHGWPHPLTRDQMTVWQDELLDLLAAVETRAAS